MNVPQSFSITGCVRAHMHAEFGKVLTKQYHRSSFLLLLICDVAIIINYSFFFTFIRLEVSNTAMANIYVHCAASGLTNCWVCMTNLICIHVKVQSGNRKRPGGIVLRMTWKV